VRSLAIASIRTRAPFIGLSLLETATTRPGTRGDVGGVNTEVSTPTGTMLTRSDATPNSRTMSAAELRDTVTMSVIRRAIRPCIRAKPYQRRSDARLDQWRAASSSCRRSMVIGWWTVATSGQPARCIAISP